jgi:hypothetical protein
MRDRWQMSIPVYEKIHGLFPNSQDGAGGFNPFYPTVKVVCLTEKKMQCVRRQGRR